MEIDLKEIYYVSLSFEFLHLKNEQQKLKKKQPKLRFLALQKLIEFHEKKSIAYNKTLAIFFNVHNTLTIIHLLLLNSNLYGKFINCLNERYNYRYNNNKVF